MQCLEKLHKRVYIEQRIVEVNIVLLVLFHEILEKLQVAELKYEV